MASFNLINKNKLMKIIPKRNPNSRKGQNGKVLVIGGSKEYFGSPALVGLASLRSGSDLCYLLVPRFIAPVIAGYSPDLIVWSYPGDYLNNKIFSILPEIEKKVDCLVIGNGLTKKPIIKHLIREIISSWQKPVIIDADAIMPDLKFKSKEVIFTPHVVEFERLCGCKPSNNISVRAKQVEHFAGLMEATILLKGVIDVVSDGTNTFTNNTGNAGMTVGGTGDTLAGICATFLSQGLKPVEAAAAAAFVNGAAGDSAFVKFGYSLIASDLINELPFVLKTIQNEV